MLAGGGTVALEVQLAAALYSGRPHLLSQVAAWFPRSQIHNVSERDWGVGIVRVMASYFVAKNVF